MNAWNVLALLVFSAFLVLFGAASWVAITVHFVGWVRKWRKEDCKL